MVQSQNTTDAKLAGMEEVGGRGKNEEGKPSPQYNSLHGWALTDRALFMANHLDCHSIYFFLTVTRARGIRAYSAGFTTGYFQPFIFVQYEKTTFIQP